MRKFTGLNDQMGSPINIGDEVTYKGCVHEVKLDHKGQIILDSHVGFGDLKVLHEHVLLLDKNQ